MIPLFKVHVPPEADASLLETLHSGYIGQGKRVDEFEARLSDLVQAPVVALNSGTAAIVLALRLAGVGPGDEVVTTAMTCTATNLPILAAGARPVWADVIPGSGLIDPDDVERKIGERTKAVVCVDWGGMPCDLARLGNLARAAGIPLIEDAAHALGASYVAHPVGAWADFTCFSFQAIKHVTTGDGGAIAVAGARLADPVRTEVWKRARTLRWYGIDRDAPHQGDSRIGVDIEEWGYKAHMNDLAAALGLAQLPHLPWILERHRANAEFYGDRLPAWMGRMAEPGAVRSAWWLYTVLLPSEKDRDDFRAFMETQGVMVSQVHKRNDEYTVFREWADNRGHLPGLDAFASRMVCIPVHWALTPAELDAVVRACGDFGAAGG